MPLLIDATRARLVALVGAIRERGGPFSIEDDRVVREAACLYVDALTGADQEPPPDTGLHLVR